MTRLDMKIETCGCQVCRSDLAYLVPCLSENSFLSPDAAAGATGNDAGRVSQPVATERPAMVEVFPIPLMM